MRKKYTHENKSLREKVQNILSRTKMTIVIVMEMMYLIMSQKNVKDAKTSFVPRGRCMKTFP